MLHRWLAVVLAGVLSLPAPGSAQVIDTVAGRAPYSGAIGKVVPIPAPGPLALSGVTGALYFATASTVYRYDPIPGMITPVAGNGSHGYTGDGGPATSAQLGQVAGLSLDAAGNLFIADFDFNVVREVSVAGTISTVAGNGTAGYSGDGGVATSASLNGPVYVAVHGTTLYIADYANGIRAVSGGRITTVPNTAGSFPLAVAVSATGILYYIDSSWATASGSHDVLREILASGAASTIAILNATGCEEGLAIDVGANFYTTDYCLNNIYRIAPGGAVAIIAGRTVSGFSADGTPALGASLGQPSDVAVDAAGAVYFTDWINNRVRKFLPGGPLTTLVGNGNGDGGAATSAPFFNLRSGVAVDPWGAVLIGDNSRVRRVALDGTITTLAGGPTTGAAGDGGPALAATFQQAIGGLAFDPAADTLIADTWNNRIRRIDATTGLISTIAGTGSPGFSGDGGSALAASLYLPNAVASDLKGNVYVGGVCDAAGINCGATPQASDPGDISVIRRISPSGTISRVAGNGASGFSGDGGPATSASLNHPVSFTTDAAGNLYIADTHNHRIRRVLASSGVITTVAGDGTAGFSGDGGPATAARLSYPHDVAVDGVGNLYVADTGNQRIRRITPAGIISTVAGSGVAAFSGDGAPAINAALNTPSRLALDAVGSTLYVVDSGNSRIRRIQGLLGPTILVASPASLSFGNQQLDTTSAAQTITLKNNGAAPLAIYSISVAGSDGSSFSAASTCNKAVLIGASCTISVRFTPGATGAHTATLNVNANAGASPTLIGLSGIGGVPALTLNTTGVTFAAQAIGTTGGTQTLTATNSGNAPLQIGSVSLTGSGAGAFSVLPNCAAPLTPGASCTLSVKFIPSVVGTVSASLNLASNAPGTPAAIPLSGTATAPPPPPRTATLTWTAPTQNTDGSTLTGVAAYHIHYGTSASALTGSVTVPGNVTSYQFSPLGSGTWYFAVSAASTGGGESAYSSIVTKTL